MVTNRDQKALDFIKLFKLVTIKQVSHAVYGDTTTANNRLLRLHKDGLLYRRKNAYDGGYCYAVNPIKSLRQYRHYINRTDFYLALIDHGAEIIDIVIDEQKGSIRPDAVIVYRSRGVVRMIALEVETRGDRANVGKYNAYMSNEWQEYFSVRPLIVYMSDRKIEDLKYENVTIEEDLSNIGLII